MASAGLRCDLIPHVSRCPGLCPAGQAPVDVPPDNPRHPGQGGFFSSLCWQGNLEHSSAFCGAGWGWEMEVGYTGLRESPAPRQEPQLKQQSEAKHLPSSSVHTLSNRATSPLLAPQEQTIISGQPLAPSLLVPGLATSVLG